MSIDETSSSQARLQAELRQYDALSKSLHLPTLERSVYGYLFIDRLHNHVDPDSSFTMDMSQLQPFLGAFRITLVSLQEHKQRTLSVLQHIARREDIVDRLIACSNFYEKNGCTLEDAQESFLVLMQEHQLVTLLVIEAIFSWREQLSRPYPFNMYQSRQNYLLRILEDCGALGRCAVGQSLNLFLPRYPLCSNTDLKQLLHRKQILRRARMVNNGGALNRGFELSAPPRPPPTSMTSLCKPYDPAAKANFASDHDAAQGRLLVAEQLLLGESAVQDSLAEELWLIADSRKCFVPLLRIPDLFQAPIETEGVEVEDMENPTTVNEEGGEEYFLPLDIDGWDSLQLNVPFCTSVAQMMEGSSVPNQLAILAAASSVTRGTPKQRASLSSDGKSGRESDKKDKRNSVTSDNQSHNASSVASRSEYKSASRSLPSAADAKDKSMSRSAAANSPSYSTFASGSKPSSVHSAAHSAVSASSKGNISSKSSAVRQSSASSSRRSSSRRSSSRRSSSKRSSSKRSSSRRSSSRRSSSVAKYSSSSSSPLSRSSQGNRRLSQEESLEELRKQLLTELSSSRVGGSMT